MRNFTVAFYKNIDGIISTVQVNIRNSLAIFEHFLSKQKMKLSFALIALASASPLIKKSTCEKKCSNYSMSVYKKCMDKDGASKDACTDASKKAYSECEGKCDAKTSRKPTTCSDKCTDYSWSIYKKCMDKEGTSKDECSAAAKKAFDECDAKC